LPESTIGGRKKTLGENFLEYGRKASSPRGIVPEQVSVKSVRDPSDKVIFGTLGVEEYHSYS